MFIGEMNIWIIHTPYHLISVTLHNRPAQRMLLQCIAHQILLLIMGREAILQCRMTSAASTGLGTFDPEMFTSGQTARVMNE